MLVKNFECNKLWILSSCMMMMRSESVDKFCSNIISRISIYFGLYFLVCCFGEFGKFLNDNKFAFWIFRDEWKLCKFFAVYVDGITYGKIIAPSVYTALSKDLTVEFQTKEIHPFSLLNLKLSFVSSTATFLNIHHINFYTDDQSNTTQINVPCSLFTRAGTYILRVEGNEINATLESRDGEYHTTTTLEHKLDVRWPNVKLSVTHEIIETYPSDSVSAVIEFLDFMCHVDTKKFEEVPSFQLELTYCGMFNVSCDSHSVPSNSTFPIEVIYGIERSRVIPLNCEYFGMEGNYVLRLKPLPPLDSSLEASAFIEVIDKQHCCWAVELRCFLITFSSHPPFIIVFFEWFSFGSLSSFIINKNQFFHSIEWR